MIFSSILVLSPYILLLLSICIDEDFVHPVLARSKCCNNHCMSGKNVFVYTLIVKVFRSLLALVVFLVRVFYDKL